MRDPAQFDAFYADTRQRLLLQTYALTGDLGASRSAVRDAFVVAWHHWRKISLLDDPESSVRPRSWQQAQRRHTARLWHRDKSIDPEVKATLDALGKLPIDRRKALLLSQLAGVRMPELAREIGITAEKAEEELQWAASDFALLRDVPTGQVPAVFRALEETIADTRWPRAPIIRRAGAARRRTHTSVGAAVALVAVLATGSVVTDSAGIRASLDRETPAIGQVGPDGATTAPPEPELLPEDAMLDAGVLQSNIDGKGWSDGRTNDNSRGNGRALPCQLERYADPDGEAALVRTFGTTKTRRGPVTSAVQMTEASASERTAERAFATARDWFAGCTDERTELLGTRTPRKVGDDAIQIVLRSWDAPVTTMVVGIARTGQFTTTTLTRVRNEEAPDVRGAGRVLGAAVNGLCSLPEGGACSEAGPALTDAPPVPVGESPAMLVEVDLPPVTKVDRPWVGTEAQRARTNLAATRCDNTRFTGKYDGATFTNAATRTYLIPEAGLPDEFGLTETVGSLPKGQAEAFVSEVRGDLAACAEDDPGTEVRQIGGFDRGQESLTIWQLSTELSDNRSFDFSMAIMRRGTSVAQLGFVAAPGVAMADGDFADLSNRALDRLVELPTRGSRR